MAILKLHCFLEPTVQNTDFGFIAFYNLGCKEHNHAKIEAWSGWNKSMTMLKHKHKHGHVKTSLLFTIRSAKS
ncbi:hypothetical protein HanPI659440_Chr14g0553871 [Helianthus annuus]|nr:hypothetical protein HanPI659440_Chr14g0553871 [Helianthus annuus]